MRTIISVVQCIKNHINKCIIISNYYYLVDVVVVWAEIETYWDNCFLKKKSKVLG